MLRISGYDSDIFAKYRRMIREITIVKSDYYQNTDIASIPKSR